MISAVDGPGEGIVGKVEALETDLEPEAIRVLIADDHALFAEVLAAALEPEPEVEVVSQAGDGAEAVALALALEPDVILMDIEMPVLDGIEATRRIRHLLPETRVVMVTASVNSTDVLRAHEAGAARYLLKGCSAADLLEAILAAAEDPAPARRRGRRNLLRTEACWAV